MKNFTRETLLFFAKEDSF